MNKLTVQQIDVEHEEGNPVVLYAYTVDGTFYAIAEMPADAEFSVDEWRTNPPADLQWRQCG